MALRPWAWVLAGLWVGCGSTTAATGETARVDPQPVPQATEGQPPPTPESEAALQPEPTPSPEPTPPPSSSPECVVVHLGLDLRVLRVPTSPSSVDMFVLHQGEELRRATPGAPPRITHVPGTGVLYAFFDGGQGPTEVARCERALAAYLPTAPTLPVSMEPAVQVTEPCRPCP